MIKYSNNNIIALSYSVNHINNNHVLPFEIVQERFLQDDLKNLKVLDSNNQKLLQAIDDIFNNLTHHKAYPLFWSSDKILH